MIKVWYPEAWADNVAWQSTDKKIVKKIHQMIKDIDRNGAREGIGKPEALKNNLLGWYSRRIITEHRLVYRVDVKNGEMYLHIISCRTHYELD